MVKAGIVYAVEHYVRQLLKEKLPDNLCFHNLSHTTTVVKACNEISHGIQLNADDKEALFIAAWFHDTGFTRTYLDHEEESKNIARDFLFKKGYAPSKANKVVQCIMATKMNQEPNDLIERIICDADLYHLSIASYHHLAQCLRQERMLVFNIQKNDAQWYLENLKFLNNHRYYTAYGKKHLEKGKQANIQKMLTVLEDLEV